MNALPPELTERIIDFFWEADPWSRRTLLSCTLTCRAWVRPSLEQMYSWLYLRSEVTWKALLRASQYDNVKSALRRTKAVVVHGDGAHETKSQWENHVALLLPALCPNVLELEASHVHFTKLRGMAPCGFVQWRRLRQLIILQCTFHNVLGHLRRFINAFSMLESLRIMSTGLLPGDYLSVPLRYLETAEKPGLSPYVRQQDLRHLHISPSRTMANEETDEIHRCIPYANVRSFQFPADWQHAASWLTPMAHRLEVLTIDYSETVSRELDVALDLSKCISLSTISLDGVSNVCELLHTLHPQSRLRTLTLVMEREVPYAWDEFAATFQRPHFAHLQAVSVRVSGNGYAGRPPRKQFYRGKGGMTLQTLLAQLRARGVGVTYFESPTRAAP